MNDLIIKEIKLNITEGGFACGPIDGSIIVSIQYTYNNETKWLTCVEFDSFPEFYLSNDSIIESINEDDIDIYDKLRDKYGITKFGSIELSNDYEELFKNIYSNIKSIESILLRALILVVRSDYDEQDNLITLLKSKPLNNITLPLSDVEEEYISMN